MQLPRPNPEAPVFWSNLVDLPGKLRSHVTPSLGIRPGSEVSVDLYVAPSGYSPDISCVIAEIVFPNSRTVVLTNVMSFCTSTGDAREPHYVDEFRLTYDPGTDKVEFSGYVPYSHLTPLLGNTGYRPLNPRIRDAFRHHFPETYDMLAGSHCTPVALGSDSIDYARVLAYFENKFPELLSYTGQPSAIHGFCSGTDHLYNDVCFIICKGNRLRRVARFDSSLEKLVDIEGLNRDPHHIPSTGWAYNCSPFHLNIYRNLPME